MKHRILFVCGTRPEVIKLARVIKEFQKDDSLFETKVCLTSQHVDLLNQSLTYFNIKADFDLKVMEENQSLFMISRKILQGLEKVLTEYKPDLIFVQGDTTTTFIAALAGFYQKIKVAHIEAGLRSFNRYLPFPEEVNRKIVSQLATYHFAPTQASYDNLIREGIDKENIWVVGNTIVDSLFFVLDSLRRENKFLVDKHFSFLDVSNPILLITAHRRENFGKPLEEICCALKELADRFPDLQMIYPVHPNPNVRNIVFPSLKKVKSIFLVEPLEYPVFVGLMKQSSLILTDSGGIQEEAFSLGKKVLVMREVTERREIIPSGLGKIVGTDKARIIDEVSAFLSEKGYRDEFRVRESPYGDGHTSEKIHNIVKEMFSVKSDE